MEVERQQPVKPGQSQADSRRSMLCAYHCHQAAYVALLHCHRCCEGRQLWRVRQEVRQLQGWGLGVSGGGPLVERQRANPREWRTPQSFTQSSADSQHLHLRPPIHSPPLYCQHIQVEEQQRLR